MRCLGSGAFATVWLAEDNALHVYVALKVLAENWTHQLDVRARFTEEARILRRADSDRLVRVLDIGELPDGRPYLVMTYADGGTLADRLLAGPLPVETALRVAAEIARGVAVLHGLGVLHRDLKPSNVLFGRDAGGQERVLVADLGLAKALAHASGFTLAAGSPGYTAPEQAQPGGGIDVRADVYALGALTYHMLTGRAPREVSSLRAVPAAAAEPVARASTLRTEVPAEVDRILTRALEARRDRRWPTAAALADAFGAAAALASAPPPARRSGRRGRRVLAACLVAVGLIAVAAGSATAVEAVSRPVRVPDSTGALSVEVPSAWAGQVRDSGWDPSTVGLGSEQAPGLAVAPDLEAWSRPTSETPGVFVGASRTLRSADARVVLPAHPGCDRRSDREYRSGGWQGTIRRWTGCGTASVSYAEILLRHADGYGVYLQIKQVGESDRTDEILASLRARSP